MTTVTQRIKDIKQPRGGYIKPKDLKEVLLESEVMLHSEENVSPILVGSVVDYLTRFMTGTEAAEAFKISLMGAANVGGITKASDLLAEITGLDDLSVVMASKLVGFDVCYRVGQQAYVPVETINADSPTISNIREMVKRSIHFFKQYGPVVLDGFSFEGGYTDLVTKGDGDFLTRDTLWDFKVSKSKPTNAHTLQLLMYYLMGLHSKNSAYFESISKLGIFNPRLNTVYYIAIDDISNDVKEEVSKAVIGY